MQKITVIIIGIIAFGYVIYKTYKIITQKSDNNSCGCDKKGCK